MGGRAPAFDALCAGEALWDLETVGAQTFAAASRLGLSPGGAAVNVASALARRGLSAALSATVGADALGRALAAQVAARGVDTRFVAEAPLRTGLVFLERGGDSPRVVAYRSDDEPPPRLPRGVRARVLLLSGLSPSPAHAGAMAELGRRLGRAGSIVVVDLNARLRLWRGRDASAAREVLESAAVIKASSADLAAMAIDAETLRSWRPRRSLLVLTDGASPLRVYGPFGELVIPCRSARAVRPIGAGDALVASLIASLVEHGTAGLHESAWTAALLEGVAAARAHVRVKRG